MDPDTTGTVSGRQRPGTHEGERGQGEGPCPRARFIFFPNGKRKAPGHCGCPGARACDTSEGDALPPSRPMVEDCNPDGRAAIGTCAGAALRTRGDLASLGGRGANALCGQ